MADEIRSFEDFSKFVKRKSNDGSNSILITGPSYVNFSEIHSELVKNGFEPEMIKFYEQGEQPDQLSDMSKFQICIGRPENIEQLVAMFNDSLIAILVNYSKGMLESISESDLDNVTERTQGDIKYNELYNKIREGQLLRSEIKTLTTLILHVVLDVPVNKPKKKEAEIRDKSIKGFEKKEITKELDSESTEVSEGGM